MRGFKVGRVQREFRRFGFGAWDYYWHMVDRWNTFIESLPKLPQDGRTRQYKALAEMHDYMINLSDMINQTETEHRAEVQALKKELAKWTENRGRKPVLTAEQREEIKQLRADGESCRKLARKFGVSERTIRRV